MIHINQLFQDTLAYIGDLSSIRQIQTVTGGTMSQAYYIETENQRYFFKTKTPVKNDFFQKEVRGLQILRKTKTISIPEVYGEWVDSPSQRGILLMEWIEGHATNQTDTLLGQRLAQLHLEHHSAFGLDEDNYLGTLPQINGWSTDWVSFYRDHRIRPQVEMGKKNGRIHGKRLKKCEKLISKIDRWLDHQPKPSPLHGDLWSGNWIVGSHGNPYLIDPAVFYGDHELEIAFTECFGGFSQRFYDAYQEIYPLSPSYPDRVLLYQLLFLIVHLNLFGEKYGQRVDDVLTYYVGK